MSTPPLDGPKDESSPIQENIMESDAQSCLESPSVPQKLESSASATIENLSKLGDSRDDQSSSDRHNDTVNVCPGSATNPKQIPTGTLQRELKDIQNLMVTKRMVGGSEHPNTIRPNEYKLSSVNSTPEAPRAKLRSQQITNNVHEKAKKETSEGRYQKLLEAKSQNQETKIFLFPLEITAGFKGDYKARQPTGVLSLPGKSRLSIRHKSVKDGEIFYQLSDLPHVVEYVPQLSPLVLEEPRRASKCEVNEKYLSADDAEQAEKEKKADEASAPSIDEQKSVPSEDLSNQ
ncbi:hypothetical protein GCK72_024014 [Caenorhabditis remanei]|uniref:Uncharacterized protein n=1 Tax=Caenorhabditis remanei TaxID=31234 RepID=A0A6A5FYX4_CAERE|nr:hypothetical protein GCK72_024014 [Caenorhabditis remanei]KAF1747549.1 hypothetical protein GCK72_024014 [Caenorhabditis remanei]